MPYGVGLKDERPKSNIERPTSNEKTKIQYRTFTTYFCFFIFSFSNCSLTAFLCGSYGCSEVPYEVFCEKNPAPEGVDIYFKLNGDAN